MRLAVLVMLGKAALLSAQGLPGEPPLPLQYIETTPTGTGVTIRTYFSSGGHPVSLLDSVQAAERAAPDTGSKPLRVLFIGNSITYYNGMARMFAALAAAGMHRRVVVGVAAYPGGSLDLLWQETDARQVVRRFPWDYVVVQSPPAALDDSLFVMENTHLFRQEIAAGKARPVLWGLYSVDSPPDEWQATPKSGVTAAARAVGATVAPVAAAWEAVRQADSHLWRRLFVSESDAHPSVLGSYLIALVAYKTITGQSPIGLPRGAGATILSQQEVDILQRAASVP